MSMPEVMAGIDNAKSPERPDIRSAGDLTGLQASALFVDRVPIAFARQHKVLGMQGDSPQMPVAITGLGSLPQLRMLGRFLSVSVRPVLASEDQILAAINVAYQQRTGAAQTFIEKLDQASVLSELANLNVREDLLDCGGRAPVIKLVNLILFEAMQARASDVHVQPYESELVVRMRIDGVLYDQFILPNALQDEVIGRLKVMGRMNIAEKRLPQDGRDTVQVGDRSVDLRIASLPTSCGERVVIRLLDKGARLFDLEELGMEAHAMRRFRQLIQSEHGLILVTGPTGSGKSTTLYAALQELDGKAKNILTLEDPIEFRLEGISQTQVNERKGLTFASGLRSVLRQDPDVIMIGEIRDKETAVMAIQSALTGHLVFSTLHTNDAASAVTRLLDLGIEPYLLASSLVGVLAQRLVRKTCGQCGGPTKGGCQACRRTGYAGRIGLFEMLGVNDPVRQQIQARATAAAIKAVAVRSNMRPLREDGLAKAAAGMTTAEEVDRVTMRVDE